MSNNTSDTSEIRHPATKRAIRNLGLGLLVVGIALAIIALLGLSTVQQIQDLEGQQKALQATDYTRAGDITWLQGTVTALKVQTPIPLATPTEVFPTPFASGQTQHYSVEIDYSGYSIGTGSYRLKFTIFPKADGDYTSTSDAQEYINQTVEAVQRFCPHESPVLSEEHFFVLTRVIGSELIRQECWDMLGSLNNGQQPKTRLPQQVVERLEEIALNPHSMTYLIISTQGRPIGLWNGDYSSSTTNCLDDSLKAVGWRGGPYFLVDTSNLELQTIFASEGLGMQYPPVMMSDLCQA